MSLEEVLGERVSLLTGWQLVGWRPVGGLEGWPGEAGVGCLPSCLSGWLADWFTGWHNCVTISLTNYLTG